MKEALSQIYAELRKENGQDKEADLTKGDTGGFGSIFKNLKLSEVYPEGYIGPVFKESVARKGEKATRTGNGKKVKQSEKPDQGRGGDPMRKRSVN